MPTGQQKLSTDAFRQVVTNGVKGICVEHGWAYDNAAQRGWAFQFWVADLVARREGLEVTPEESIFLNNDCGIDIILEDQNQKRYYMIQAKIHRPSAAVEESDASHLCDRHGLFLDREWVKKHVTQEMQFDVLGGYEDLLRSGYSIHYCFVTTALASERVKDVITSRQADINREEPAVTFEILDGVELKEFMSRQRRSSKASRNGSHSSCRKAATRSRTSPIKHFLLW